MYNACFVHKTYEIAATKKLLHFVTADYISDATSGVLAPLLMSFCTHTQVNAAEPLYASYSLGKACRVQIPVKLTAVLIMFTVLLFCLQANAEIVFKYATATSKRYVQLTKSSTIH